SRPLRTTATHTVAAFGRQFLALSARFVGLDFRAFRSRFNKPRSRPTKWRPSCLRPPSAYALMTFAYCPHRLIKFIQLAPCRVGLKGEPSWIGEDSRVLFCTKGITSIMLSSARLMSTE